MRFTRDHAPTAGEGLRVSGREHRRADRGRGRRRAHPGPRDPAGVGGGLGLRRPDRATSRRPASTPGGASSTDTTIAGGSGATAGSSRHARLREGAARLCATRCSATSAGARSPASGSSPAPCGCSIAASSGSAPRTTRRRTRPTGSRRCGSATSRSRARRSSSTTRPRGASGAFRTIVDRDDLATGQNVARAKRRGLRAARLSQRRQVARHPLDRDQRLHQGGDRRGAQRQGLPHLERDRARGGGARRLGARARHEYQGRPQSGQARRREAGVADYLGNTPAVCRASYIDPRVFDRFDGGLTVGGVFERLPEDPADWPEIQRPIEEAVLDLIDRRESPAIERVR